MAETQGKAVRFFRCLALWALASLCPCAADARQAPTPRQTPPTQQTPQQTPPQRTGRSYDTAAPARKAAAPLPQSPSPVTFADVTAQTGINFRHHASPTSQKYLPETMGGGVAQLDYDNDGRLDIFFTNGAALSDPMPKSAQADKREPRFWNRLYRQKPDGTFEDVTERANLRGEGYSMGAAAGDFDADGHTDIYVAGLGSAGRLYRNRGDGSFEDVTQKLKAAVTGWGTSAGWFDYDRDGRLDLFVARYMDWDFERGALFCGTPQVRAYCHPDNFKGAAPVLLRQKADGTFEDVSLKAGVSDPEGKSLGVAFADFDGDGWTDVFVANDNARQFLFRNKADGTFEDVALMAGAGYDENGKSFAGMGVDAADYDGDGRVDVFVTALSNETYPLYRNNGDMTFAYATNTTGLAAITVPYSGWGARFLDADNDGLRDIFVAQGHVLDTIEKTTGHIAYRQTPLLLRNAGKTFVNVSDSAGLKAPLAARGAAFGDLDNDGDTDVVLAQTDGPAVVLRNSGAKNHWLGLTLAGARGNRHGLGARVVVTDSVGGRQVFDVTAAGSYLSSNDPRLLVGLGVKTARAVEVRWPGGKVQTINSPAVDTYHTVREQP